MHLDGLIIYLYMMANKIGGSVINDEAATSTQSLQVEDKEVEEYDVDSSDQFVPGSRPWILQSKVWVAIALGQVCVSELRFV